MERGGASHNVKLTCVTCGKKHYVECLLGTGSSYGCAKEGYKVIDCPMINTRGRESMQVTPSVPKDDAPTRGLSMHSKLEDQIRMKMVMMMRVSPCIYF